MLNILLFFFVFFTFLTTYAFFLEFRLRKRQLAEKYEVVQVRVPKNNELGPIVVEHMFSSLHGLALGDKVSFELASIDGQIKFYISFPARVRNLVEGQIYASYPDVEIEDCKDYAFLAKKNRENAFGVEISLASPDIFPIKRYSQFEDKLTRLAIDPLAGVTASLVKFKHFEDQAWIQFIVTPLDDRWRVVFTRCVKILAKSFWAKIPFVGKIYADAFCTRKSWLRILFFPVYVIFWFQGFLANLGVDLSPTVQATSVDENFSTNHDNEGSLDAAMNKVIKPLFAVKLRIVYLPKEKNSFVAKAKLGEIIGAFKQFNLPHLNGFAIDTFLEGEKIAQVYRKRFLRNDFVLNAEELATVFHMPGITVKTPTIYWVASRKLEPPLNLPPEVAENGEKTTVLGKTAYRGGGRVFGIKAVDRRRHVYIIGKTGMGKSTVLENMIYSDILAGKGVGVIDPHGDLADAILSFIPKNRVNDVVLIDPADREYAVAFNMLENVDPALNSIVASGLVGIFKKIYADSWGPRLEHILRNTILALLEYPGTTMLGITRILQDKVFRSQVIKKIEDPVVRSFWIDEFEKMQDKFRVEAISPILNKVGQFLSSPTIRNIVGQPKSTVDLRFFMDKGKIVIINLSKGKIGEDNSALLGSMFITKFQLDAMSRAHLPENERKDFYLYVDEFQNFATDSFATILSEARKYKLNLTMANQYIAQMPEEVKDAVFGNVGSIFAFQVGYDDAEYLSQQFGEEVLPADLVSLSKYTAYMRLLVDGMPTKTFSLVTLPPPKIDFEDGYLEKVRRVSNERYGRKVEIVNDKIRRWSENRNDGVENTKVEFKQESKKFKL